MGAEFIIDATSQREFPERSVRGMDVWVRASLHHLATQIGQVHRPERAGAELLDGEDANTLGGKGRGVALPRPDERVRRQLPPSFIRSQREMRPHSASPRYFSPGQPSRAVGVPA
jgi:hypothetical protein